MKIGPYTISRGTIIPYTEEAHTMQKREVAESGDVNVVDVYDYELKKVRIIVPRGEALNIYGFLKNGRRFSADTTTLEDDYGTLWMVRLWDRKIQMKTVRSNQVEMVMLFRVEVA